MKLCSNKFDSFIICRYIRRTGNTDNYLDIMNFSKIFDFANFRHFLQIVDSLPVLCWFLRKIKRKKINTNVILSKQQNRSHWQPKIYNWQTKNSVKTGRIKVETNLTEGFKGTIILRMMHNPSKKMFDF